MVFDAKQKVLIVDIVQITHPKLVECPLGLDLFFFLFRVGSAEQEQRSRARGPEPKTNESKPRKLPISQGSQVAEKTYLDNFCANMQKRPNIAQNRPK